MLQMAEPVANVGVTYNEIRWWAVWLDKFTAADLADAMGVNVEVGERGVRALLWHGICEHTGVEFDTPYGQMPVVSYKPLPPGPTHHPTRPPEWKTTPGCGSLAMATGMPVRLVDNTKRREAMQGTGGGRLRVKNRDRAYERMQEAIRKRAEKQRAKARARAEDPKGKHRDGDDAE